MKSIRAEFLWPIALPGVNHMRGMQYQIVLNITICPIQLYKFVCTISTQNINLHSKLSVSSLLQHTWVKAIMQLYAHTTKHS